MIDIIQITRFARQFYAAPGERGIFEVLFRDEGSDRGGWVHRAKWILVSNLPEEIEAGVRRLKKVGVTALGFAAMGGESSIIGPSTQRTLNVSSTSPRKIHRLIGNRSLRTLRWSVVSKSGSTTETRSNANYLEKLYHEEGLEPEDYITYVTDPGTKLESEKTKEGFRVEHREFNNQTTVGGRNTLFNNPTLTAYAWQYPGKLRPMLETVVRAHTFTEASQDPWMRGAFEVFSALRQGRHKVALVMSEWLRRRLWVWLQQNPEEALGKDGKGFTVYTTPPDLKTLKELKDQGWVFVELRLPGEESQTETYAQQAKSQGYPVMTIDLPKIDKIFIPQVVSYGWMKFVAFVGGLWGINFSDQPPVEEYKKLMKDRLLTTADAFENAKGAYVSDTQMTLIYDGLLPFLTQVQQAEIERMKTNKEPLEAIYAKLLQFTRKKLDAQTLAIYDDVDEKMGEDLDLLTQELLHKKLGYAAKWGEGTGVLHGLFVNWFSGPLHQIPVHIVARDHGFPRKPYYVEGPPILISGAVAAHMALVNKAKRPSMMLVIDGQLPDASFIHLFFERVLQHLKQSENKQQTQTHLTAL